jgi:HAD superfamily hydrolase (TIGR01450 family)
MSSPGPATIEAFELLERYDTLLLDAFGVLVHSGGALPSASRFIETLCRRDKRFFVVTNDASTLPENSARRFQGFGLQIREQSIITSGSLIAPYFEAAGLTGARCLVLGPADSKTYVRQAGGELVEAAENAEYDALVVCDDDGYPFLPTLDLTLSSLIRLFDAGRAPRLILPNPDLIYPKGERGFGFTSGAVVLLLEAALHQRYPVERPTFVRLGKPFGPIFREARRRSGDGSLVMIGDQLETDVAGARAAGIDAALLATGVTNWERSNGDPKKAPTFLLRSLQI